MLTSVGVDEINIGLKNWVKLTDYVLTNTNNIFWHNCLINNWIEFKFLTL